MSRYKSRHTGATIDDAVDRAKAGGAIDTALQNKAPSFPYYSAYSNSEIDAALNDLLNKGIMYKTIFSAININVGGLDLAGGLWGIELVNANGFGYAIATSYDSYGVVRKMRKFIGDTWEPWEYINPPMIPGKEYRTTERWNGAPVYAQIFDCSPLPNATTKVFPVEGAYADNVVVVVDYGGMSTYYGQSLQNKDFVSLNVTQSKISITTKADYSAGNAYVWVKYVKSPS